LVHRASAGGGVAFEVGLGVLVGFGLFVGPVVGGTAVSVGVGDVAVGVSVGRVADALGDAEPSEAVGLVPELGVGEVFAK
jgi:hypothetical protein